MGTAPEPHNRFDAAADAYGRARPPYPADAVRWIVAGAGLGRGATVLDLGAGTGDLTVQLVAAGLDVSATEPSRPMRELLASRAVLTEIHTDRAEDLGSFEDGGFDLVTVANALHWLEPVQTYSEVRRVLSPGGHLAVVWHLPDQRDPLQARLWSLVEHLHAEAAPYPGPLPGGEPGWAGQFEHVATERFTLLHRLPRTQLAAYVGSWSGVANLDAGPREALLAEVGGWSVAETIELPFEIEVLLGRRIGDLI